MQWYLTVYPVQPKSTLQSREKLVLQSHCSGKHMFINCAAFLRIRQKHFQNTVGYVDPSYDVLDDTRIHPEDYELARQMAADVLEIDRDMYDEENLSHHVQELMEGDPERLQELNELLLDDYAYQLEKRLGEPKQLTLNQTRTELLEPYGDRRKHWNPGSPDQIFTMLTGETDETLYEGVLTSGEITKILEKSLRMRLPNGLDGYVPITRTVARDAYREHQRLHRDKPPGPKDVNLMTFGFYKVDQAYEATVVRIEKDRMQVELDLMNVHGDAMRPPKTDEYFKKERERNDAIDVQRMLNRWRTCFCRSARC